MRLVLTGRTPGMIKGDTGSFFHRQYKRAIARRLCCKHNHPGRPRFPESRQTSQPEKLNDQALVFFVRGSSTPSQKNNTAGWPQNRINLYLTDY
jgi:hypothetical protein